MSSMHIRTPPVNSRNGPQDTLLSSSRLNDSNSSGQKKLDSKDALSGLNASLTQTALQAHTSRNECIDETWLSLSQKQGFLKTLDSPIASFTSQYDINESLESTIEDPTSEFERKESSNSTSAPLVSDNDRQKVESPSTSASSFRVRIIASPIDLENIVFAVRLHSGLNSGEVADWPLKPERSMTRSAIIAEIADDAAEGGFAFEVVP
jgi:hypothetical protein